MKKFAIRFLTAFLCVYLIGILASGKFLFTEWEDHIRGIMAFVLTFGLIVIALEASNEAAEEKRNNKNDLNNETI